MTKEKPLSEKAWEGKYGIHDKHYTKEDVALAVKRLKEHVRKQYGLSPSKMSILKEIDEIFGEFK